MGSISRLDAVNQMLLSAGESLVSDLEGNSGIDTGLAEFILDQTSQDYQLRGLANNRFVKKYKLDSAGDIMLPDNVLAAELISNHVDSDGNVIIGIDRQKKLFNIVENKFNWKSGVEYNVEIVFELSWEDLSTPSQRGILATAQRQYQLIVQGDDISDRYLGEAEMLHKARSKAADINDRRVSIFQNGSRVMMRALQRETGTGTGMDPVRFRFWRHRGA
tara:strand:+ start:779 stop:1435 length:657 start_codon:yes stop_codon:yes gene_type:complete